MAAWTIDGTTVKVAEFARGPDIEVGERIRTASGLLRSSIRAVKRTWRMTCTEVSGSEYTTLLGLLSPTTTHTLAGDEVGSSYTVVTIIEEDRALQDGAAAGRIVRVRLEQV